jgi:HPr kinase/phosphorylase
VANNKSIPVETLFAEKKDEWGLEILAGGAGLSKRKIITADMNRPGLALAGYTGYFLAERVQIIGKTEVSYLATLETSHIAEAFKRVFSFEPPCFCIAESLTLPAEFLQVAEETEIPVLRTNISTTPFIHLLSSYLDLKLAPETHIHGTLVDVYGVGVLIVGDAGIGKSECALDLVERGHRLVSDDLVRLVRMGSGFLIGRGAEKSELLLHHMEIRGVGIIDIAALYGIRAIRLQKRVEVQVELVPWGSDLDYERLGLEDRFTEILETKIPLVRIPMLPGKNIAIVIEVIAMNYLLKLRGYNPAKLFNAELKRILQSGIGHREDDLE